jgi:hypothetical protein
MQSLAFNWIFFADKLVVQKCIFVLKDLHGRKAVEYTETLWSITKE